MSSADRRLKLDSKAAGIEKALVGKKVVSLKMPTKYPAEFAGVELIFDDGSILDIGNGGGGCSDCDPDGIGWGVRVDFSKGK